MVEQGVSTVSVVVSAVGAFGGGALVGALANHWLRVQRESKQEEQERKSLLSLVLSEILANDTTATRWASPPQEGEKRGKPPTLGIDVWEDARTRLAYLVPHEHFYPVIRYYNAVYRWKTKSEEEAFDYWKGLDQRAGKAVERIKYYLGEEGEQVIREYEEELDRLGLAAPDAWPKRRFWSSGPPEPGTLESEKGEAQESVQRPWWSRLFRG